MTTKTTDNISFKLNKVYEMRFITDSDLKSEFTCTKLTAKQATFQGVKNSNDVFTKKIMVHNNIEYVLYGSYSMAPVIKANRVI